jgi:hypothetical protein
MAIYIAYSLLTVSRARIKHVKQAGVEMAKHLTVEGACRWDPSEESEVKASQEY